MKRSEDEKRRKVRNVKKNGEGGRRMRGYTLGAVKVDWTEADSPAGHCSRA